MRSLIPTGLSAALFFCGAIAIAAEPDAAKTPVAPGAPAQATPVTVEHSKPLPSPGLLGTAGYQITDRERKFLDRWSNATEATKPESLLGTKLSGKVGKGVSWFGIVRGVTEDKSHNQTRLQLEMKYFDGLCDIDLQVVSIYGAGDFTAIVPGVGHDIKRLSLVVVAESLVQGGRKKNPAGLARCE